MDNLKKKITELESRAGSLSPNADHRRHYFDAIKKYTEEFISSVSLNKVINMDKETGMDDDAFQFQEQGMAINEMLEQFNNEIVAPGISTTSSKFFGFIPGGGIFSGAMGDYLSALTNKYAGNSYASPGASMCERSLVKWFAKEAGYPETAQGDLTSGGSIANLSAILTAREDAGLKSKDYDHAVVYMTTITHHCVRKALKIAGLGDCQMRYIPVDELYRMDTRALGETIKKDREEGYRPWLVVASAGTTDLGSIDPLHSIADICEEHNLWFHADGAYGGAFVLCEEGKKRLSGIERADSLIIDPHKGMFLSYGTGMVIVREGRKLLNTFQESAPYMQDAEAYEDNTVFSASDLSPELSRHFRGLRLWLSLKVHGIASFRAALEEKLLLAEYFHNRLDDIDGFDMGPYPQMSVAAFRYVPKEGDANTFNERLRDALQSDGQIYLSSTTIQDHFVLRFAILSYDSHLDDIDFAIEQILSKVALLEEG